MLLTLQEAGLIVMQLKSADTGTDKQAVNDSQFSQIWMVLNAKPQAASFTIPAGKSLSISEHCSGAMGILKLLCDVLMALCLVRV